jgi:hypothetical protein
MAEMVQGGQTLAAKATRAAQLVRAAQVARETPVRQSANGVRFATFGETGLVDLDLDRMIEAVPAAIVGALKANTYYFVPLALREAAEEAEDGSGSEPSERISAGQKAEPAMVASAYTDELSDAAICHRNVELGHGKRGVFISTRLMGDRFALSFEFFINVAHAFVEQAGVPAAFGEMVWKQAVENVRGETSLDAWESRNLAFGRTADAQPEEMSANSRRARGFGGQRMFGDAGRGGGTVARLDGSAGSFTSAQNAVDEKERGMYLAAAYSDAVAMYLLALALDFDYSELREREYPLLAPAALAARLRWVAELFPPNPGYEFAVRYRRRA